MHCLPGKPISAQPSPACHHCTLHDNGGPTLLHLLDDGVQVLADVIPNEMPGICERAWYMLCVGLCQLHDIERDVVQTTVE